MMKKKLLLPVVFMLLACGVFTAPADADVGLYDWAVNIDGVISAFPSYDSKDSIPPEIDDSLFDDVTGLGTLTATISGAGDHFVGLFVDHEIDEPINTFYNETGATSGTPAAGQTWEIDEPGWVSGDIYENLELSDATGSWLDNGIGTSVYGDTTFPDDVSMAMGWEFTLGGGLYAEIDFLLSDIAPPSGFYLQHNDPDSPESVYFSSSLNIVPVPGAVLMGVVGFGSVGWLGRCRAFKRFFVKK